MKYCEQCGAELTDDADFCTECGTKCETDSDTERERVSKENLETTLKEKKAENTPKKNSKMKLLIIILVALLATGSVGYFVVYPQVTKYLQAKENQKEADKVINLIDSLKEKEITAESEDDLKQIQSRYDELSKEQKKLVTNYKELEEAYQKLEAKKDEKAALEIVDSIDAVNQDKITAEDTSLKTIRDNYDKLSDSQKKLVTNIKKLEDYEKVYQEKVEKKEKEEKKKQQEKEKKQKMKDIVYNFPGYEGFWGDFGAHINSYQGMIEKAVKSKISLTDYFAGDPNDVYLSATGFQWDGENIANAGCFLTFEGLSPSGGMYRTLVGTVSFDSSGNLVFYEVEYY